MPTFKDDVELEKYLAEYRARRIEDLGKKLQEETSADNKKNIRLAIKLYREGKLPPHGQTDEVTYIQGGETCDLEDIDFGSKFVEEVTITQTIILFHFTK
jgi:hypothetical protein